MANFVIDFVDTLTSAQIGEFLAAFKLTTKQSFDHFPNTVVVTSTDKFVPDAALYPEVESITDTDAKISLLTDTVVDSIVIDPAEGDKWWYNAISIGDGVKVDSVWNYLRRGGYTTVYMVDSGCEIAHPEFEGRPVTQLWTFLENDHGDTNGHGTALTSVITGKTLGMSQAAVKQIKIFDKKAPTTLANIIDGFDALIADHILTPNCKVVNLSWSVPKSAAIESKLSVMRELGLHIVCASGNSGAVIGDVTPASMASITTVGSYGPNYHPSKFTDITDSAISVSNGPSNGGVGLDVWAPGENILAATIGGSYGVVAGTSVASAVFSGLAATYLGSYPDMIILPDDLYEFRGMQQRFGLLDFSDARYAACPNRIVLARSAQDEPHIDGGILGIFHPGDTISKQIVLPETVGSVSFENIPSWMAYENGRLSGIAPATTEPVAFRFVLTAETNGTAKDSMIIIYVVPTGTDKEFHSVTDISQPLDYVLLGYFGCGCTSPKSYCCNCSYKGGNDCVTSRLDCINYYDPYVNCP